jgi:hypothetical protein
MKWIDTVNRGAGRATPRIASAGIVSAWTMKRDFMTPVTTA